MSDDANDQVARTFPEIFRVPHRIAEQLERCGVPWLGMILQAAAEIRRRKAALIRRNSAPVADALEEGAAAFDEMAEVMLRQCSESVRNDHRDLPGVLADDWHRENPGWPRQATTETSEHEESR